MGKVVAEIIEIRGSGHCSAGHHIGERFVFTKKRCPEICPWALGAILMPVMVLLNDGRFQWSQNNEPTYWCCPDPENTVVFRLGKDCT